MEASRSRTDHREEIYADYADAFKGSTGVFDRTAAARWEPFLRRYPRGWLPESNEVTIVHLGRGDGGFSVC